MKLLKKMLKIGIGLMCITAWILLFKNITAEAITVKSEVISYEEYLKSEKVVDYESTNEFLINERIERAKQLEAQEMLERLKKQKETEQKLAEEKKNREEELHEKMYGWKTFKATYYTSRCDGCVGITKTGIDVRDTIYYNGMRIIAVDPSVIKLGSIVEVKTPHETFKAISGDVGSAIKGKRVDILVSSKKQAYSLGRHDVQIRLLK